MISLIFDRIRGQIVTDDVFDGVFLHVNLLQPLSSKSRSLLDFWKVVRLPLHLDSRVSMGFHGFP